MKLVVCVPTYNNPAYIREILDGEFSLYSQLDYCLYIADSSEDNDTEEIVSYYQKKSDNLFYVKFPAYIHANEKVYRMLEKVGEDVCCDYAWIRSDSLRASEELLYSLRYFFSKKYDAIVVNPYEGWKRGIYEEKQLNSLFEEYACVCALFGAVIVRKESIIKGTDWKMLSERYLTVNRRNFSHVCFLFERLLDIERAGQDAKVLLMNLTSKYFWGTPMKKQSSWHREIFEIWLEYWPEALNSLPDYYKNKEIAIRNWGKRMGRYSTSSLLKLKKEGILDKEVYEFYQDKIKQYGGVSYKLFENVLNNNLDEEQLKWNDGEMESLCDFCARYDKIAIYGCGIKAKRYFEFLQKEKIKVDSFYVSDNKINNNASEFMDVVVKGFGTYVGDEHTGLVLALNEENTEEVYPEVLERGLKEATYGIPADIDDRFELYREMQNIASNEKEAIF